jgi:uncharacterized protein (DUF2132 family)
MSVNISKAVIIHIGDNGIAQAVSGANVCSDKEIKSAIKLLKQVVWERQRIRASKKLQSRQLDKYGSYAPTCKE